MLMMGIPLIWCKLDLSKLNAKNPARNKLKPLNQTVVR